MRRILVFLTILAMPAMAGCVYGLGYDGPEQPMMATGAPCGDRAVDAGICPKQGYRVPPGRSY
jgi:hypothetical protein